MARRLIDPEEKRSQGERAYTHELAELRGSGAARRRNVTLSAVRLK
jgi:hypothetical protein